MASDKHAENRAGAERPPGGWQHTLLLSLTSLGVVYGDIGTSPLYAMRECFFGQYGVEPSEANVLGVLSLITWSLILVISVKYLVFVLRADYDGEGGILALTELARRPVRGFSRRMVLIIGLFGAALLYGDGMITPAISVLSAIEGLNVTTAAFKPYVVPVTIAVLIGLFLLQKVGTGRVGRLFGPIMVLWFTILAVSGAIGTSRQPAVLAALNPYYGMSFFKDHGWAGLTTLGIVFLAVTGGEALYADIGHFGKPPIRIGWYAFVMPSLLLNYYGQGASILARPGQIGNPFYQLVPSWAIYPMVVMATCATVIASQAVISGAFSLTFQGAQLGYLPRLNIRHTSSEQRGQIYVPLVNWILMVAAIGLVMSFRHSGNLAAAYGVAISATMVITTALFFVVLRGTFMWPLPAAGGLAGVFLIIDLAFFTANMGKVIDGGWFPLLVAALIFLLMTTWQRGFVIESRKSRNRIQTVRQFLADIGGGGTYRRVPGQAVYLTHNARGTPHSLRHNLIHNHALHDKVVLYTATFVKSPHVPPGKRFRVTRLRQDITRVVAFHGFMESPNVPEDLGEVNREYDLGLALDRVTYFVGGGILLPTDKIGMSGWRARLYALMARNERQATRYFNLPPSQVFEIGIQIQV